MRRGPGLQNLRFALYRLLPERSRKAAEGSMIKLIAPFFKTCGEAATTTF